LLANNHSATVMSDNDEQGPPAGNDNGDGTPAPAAPVAPVAPVPETNEDIIRNWLATKYLEREYLGLPLQVTMQEFLNIIATGSTDNNLNSWLLNNHLDLTTLLLTELKAKSDILVIPSDPATTLAHVGLGVTDPDFFKGGLLTEKCYEAMNKEDIRWVVVPVTDGMADRNQARRDEAEARAAAKAAKVKENKTSNDPPIEQEEAADQPEISPPNPGTHWGFMIVDKQNNDARWLDGNLKLKKDNRKWSIERMSNAGWVAGKILCGYDRVMGLERGGFTAATLKHVPHDTKDNAYKGDKGSACGPWVYAMLEYILKRPFILENPGGLYNAFRKRHLNTHKRLMAFNSLKTREDMQKIIRDEAEPNLSVNELPYNMMVRILNILYRPATSHLLSGIDRFNLLSRSQPKRGRNGGSGKGPAGGDNDDDNDDDHDDGDGFSHIDKDLQAAILATLADQHRRDPKNKDTSAQGSYDISKTGDLTIPDGRTMPKDFADTNEVDAAALELWKQANDSILEPLITNRSKANDMSYRAALHASSKRGWNKESDDRMKGIWRTDSNAVNGQTEDVFTAAQIRQMMMSAYRVQDDEEKTGRPTITGGVIGRATVPTKKRTKVYPPGSGPSKLPQFAITSISNLDIFVNHNPDLFADRDLSKLAKETQRAVMHRTYIGSFKEDSRQNWREVWYKDPHAFTEEERNENWSWAAIVQRMDDTYNNLELPPTFMSLSHAEIDIWLQNLPEVIRNRMKNRDGEVLYDRAPGILHRLFVGEFEELRAEGARNSPENIKLLADWREKDPEKYGSVTEAVNRLKFRFGSDDGGSLDLPFLRESPLHWPPRKHLPARERGTKRKPTSPVPGGGAPKKTKIDKPSTTKEKNQKSSSESASTPKGTPQGRQAPSGSGGHQGFGESQGLPGPIDPSGSSHQPKSRDTDILADVLEMYPPDFTHTIKARRQAWIETFSDATAARIEGMDEWPQKAVLQHLFGGLDTIPKPLRHIWRKRHPLLNDKMTDDDVPGALKDTVKEFGEEGACQQGILYYPEYYMTAFEKEHEELIETMTNAKRDAVEGNGQGQGGGKEHEDLSDDDFVDLDNFENEDVTAQPAGGAATQGAKRKHAGGTANPFPAKRHKGDRPDFCTMEEPEVLFWLAKVPLTFKKELLDSKLNLLPLKSAYARVMLKRIFNKTFQNWAAEDPLTEETLGKLRQWRLLGTFSGSFIANPAGLKKFLDKILYPDKTAVGEGKRTKKETVVLPDYSSNTDKWPENWR